MCWIFAKSSPGAPSHGGGIGGFLITLGAAFGYAVGWNPYAADYTRYFAPDTSKKAVALWSGLGVFVSCVLLEAAGAASATVTGIGAIDGNPTGAFTGHLPTALADLTLLAIALGAIAANVLNIYSGALSFTAMGIKLPLALRRAIVAGVFGVIGFIVALTGLHDAGTKYKNFLLVIAYWIAPWLAVMFCDQFLRRRQHPRELERLLFDTRYHELGRAGGHAGRRGGVDHPVLEPDRVRRHRAQARPVGRRPDLRGRLPHHRRHLPELARHHRPPPPGRTGHHNLTPGGDARLTLARWH